MMEAVRTEERTASVVLDAADRLIGDLADAVPALQAVGDALALLAEGLGVAKVIVAVDDARLGRQVFCSGRAPLGSEGIGLRGPQGAWTQPPRALDDVAASVLVRAVGVGVVRSAARVPEPVLAATTTPALDDALATATARAVRHGWGFTLVLVRGGARLAEVLGKGMRAADLLVVRDDHDVALVLPQTAGDRVPHVLARLTAGRDTPPFNYGLACCPADGTDPAVLYRTAAERLALATRAATDS